MAELERPYMVCDRCGHVWCAAVEVPSRCEGCGHGVLWSFPSLEEAEELSEHVVSSGSLLTRFGGVRA